LNGIAWYNLVPSALGGMPTLVTAGGGTYGSWSDGVGATGGMDWIVSAAAPDGSLLVAYVPDAHTGSFSVAMSAMAPSKRSRARWYDPTSGQWTADASGTGYSIADSGTQTFAVPQANSGGTSDWVLVLDAQ
jgi:hypothetical protein